MNSSSSASSSRPSAAPIIIDDLRELLFNAIEGVKDGTLDIEKAKMIGTLSQVMVKSAAVEVKHAQVTGQKGATFLIRPKRFLPGSPVCVSIGWLGDEPDGDILCRYASLADGQHDQKTVTGLGHFIRVHLLANRISSLQIPNAFFKLLGSLLHVPHEAVNRIYLCRSPYGRGI